MTTATVYALLILVGAVAIDGDTLRVRDPASGAAVDVRLWGVDAPELHDEAGPVARQALAEWVAGRVVLCVPMDISWRRVVARCSVDGKDLARALVRAGLARDCPRWSHGAYADDEPPAMRVVPPPARCRNGD